MQYLLALFPVVVVVILMVVFRLSSQVAGPLAWLTGLFIAAVVFGLNWDVLWVSQVKGLMLSVYVLLVIWPALFLYLLVNSMGGIQAMVKALEQVFPTRGLLWLVLAWAFSGVVEGLSGFGLPLAIVAPMLVGVGLEPMLAVAAVAVGHAWAVTFGSMGMGLQTLSAVVKMDAALLAPPSAFLLALGSLGCGLGVMILLKQKKLWPLVVVLSVIMGLVYYTFAAIGLVSLAAFASGVTGIIGSTVYQRLTGPKVAQPLEKRPASLPLKGALAAYGLLVVLMLLVGLVAPLRAFLSSWVWAPLFPAVTTTTGLTTPAATILSFRPFIFSGTFIIVVCITAYFYFRSQGLIHAGNWRSTSLETWRGAAPASVGIITMVGLSTLMEHCGMTQLLAQGLSQMMGSVFPLVSPLVGMLGTFTTGSNNNSNVLFGPLQKSVALMLNFDPAILISAQTAGGSLGSMIAPAKIIVGCSTVGLIGKDGDVLRRTLPFGLAIGLGIGVATLVLLVGHFTF